MKLSINSLDECQQPNKINKIQAFKSKNKLIAL